MSTTLDTHKDAILEALEQNESKASIARRYGVPATTFKDWLDRLGRAPDPGAVGDAGAGGAVQAVSEADVLAAENEELKRLVKRQRETEVAYVRLEQLIARTIAAAVPAYEPPRDEPSEHRGHVQALLLSDLHAGEVVKPEAVGGANEFNWDVLVSRMDRVREALLSYQHNRPYPIEELQLWWLGDMCSGSNHPEIVETNEFSAAEQGHKVGMLLGQWTESLVEHYPRITIHGVAGNHPRVPAKPQSKNVFNNFDWVAYKIAETYLRGYESIKCSFPRSGFTVAEIAGLKYLLFHGDGIRSTMPGVPFGGVMRRVKELKAQWADMGVTLDGFALGHFHQANVVQPEVIMNGSLKGADEHGIKHFGSNQPPEQLLLTFDPHNKRRTDVSRITP